MTSTSRPCTTTQSYAPRPYPTFRKQNSPALMDAACQPLPLPSSTWITNQKPSPPMRKLPDPAQSKKQKSKNCLGLSTCERWGQGHKTPIVPSLGVKTLLCCQNRTCPACSCPMYSCLLSSYCRLHPHRLLLPSSQRCHREG